MYVKVFYLESSDAAPLPGLLPVVTETAAGDGGWMVGAWLRWRTGTELGWMFYPLPTQNLFMTGPV